jgi:hypothetical protein
MGAGGSTAGAAGDDEVEFRPRRQRYAGPGTQPVPPGHLRVRVPPGLGPGSEAAFQTPDGRVMRAVIPAGARAGSVFDVRLPPRRDISVSERQEVNDMAARQLSAMAAVRNTLGDVVIDDEAIEGALVVHNFDVEKAVAHLIESGALTQRVANDAGPQLVNQHSRDVGADAPLLTTAPSPKPAADAYVNALEAQVNPLRAGLALEPRGRPHRLDESKDVLDPSRCLLSDGGSAADAKPAPSDFRAVDASGAEAKTAALQRLGERDAARADAKAAAPVNASPGAGQATAAAPAVFERQNAAAVRSLAQSPLTTTATADLLDFTASAKDEPAQFFEPQNMSDADAKEALQVVEAKEAADSAPITTLEVVDSHVDRISGDDIRTCTNNFGTCLGEGGVGSVYRGNRDGDVAVKRLQNFFSEGYDFVVEVNVLARLGHRNLVPLLGYTCDATERCLVYEFCKGGSVFAKLRTPRALTWSDRLDVADDVASGLKFLRENDVVHGGVKTTNILLASSEAPYVAKLGDGGLGRLLVRNEGKPVIPQSAVDHSRGYVDPAYAKKGNVVAASDVYACGVVLLELLSGQLPFTPGREPPSLAKFAFDADYDEKTLLDPTLSDCPPRVASGLSEVAAKCLSEKRKQRCKIREVSESLHDLRDAMRNFRMATLSRTGLTPVRRGAASLQAVRAVSAFGGLGSARPLRPAPVLQQSPGTRLGAKPLPF